MNNTNAKLKLTFDSLDTTQSRSSSNGGFQCEHSIANTHPFRAGAINIDSGAANILLVHGGNLFEKP